MQASSPDERTSNADPITAAAAGAAAAGWREQSFDAAQAGAWRWDLATGDAFVDEPWCVSLQLDPCRGTTHVARWAAHIHPDDVNDYRRRMGELACGTRPDLEVEYRILTLDSRWLWILQRGRVVQRAASGVPALAIGICIDIDRRKREETTLRSSESRLATALWGARASFWQLHVPTSVRTVSAMWYAMTGYTREQWESVPDPWLSRLHADDRIQVGQALQRYQEGGSDSLEYEYRLRSGSGEWRWMLDRARAVEWDLEGHPAVIMGVSLDVDAQKRTEMELRTSEARLQTAVWGARMGLWEMDVERDSTRWFDDWCRQYGVDSCDGTDHVARWDSYIHPEDVGEAARRFSAHLAGSQDYYDSEYRIMTRGGEWRWIFERGRVIERDDSGKALRMVGVCMDIDARRREQQQDYFTQRWLEDALDVSRGGMWRCEVATRASVYTDSYYRLFGVEPAAGRADSTFWQTRVHPDDRERVDAAVWSVIEQRAPQYEVSYRVRHEDGSWRRVLDRGRASGLDATGRVRWLVGFIMDITDWPDAVPAPPAGPGAAGS